MGCGACAGEKKKVELRISENELGFDDIGAANGAIRLLIMLYCFAVLFQMLDTRCCYCAHAAAP